jgi:hypothetical protein
MATKPLQAASINNPQQMFESALSVVTDRGSRSRRLAARTQPIVGQHTELQVEMRALTDAARALAAVWKVSPNLVR